jgi:hypothetical protein
LLRHGDAVPACRGGHGGDQAARAAAENDQVVLTALTIGPTRRMALADRLLVVNVRGEKLDGRHHVSSFSWLSS